VGAGGFSDVLARSARSAVDEVLEGLRKAVGRSPSSWHRVGWRENPTDYLPHEECSWEHRFDDLHREYRTLYCADSALTAIREVLADLRPNAIARAEYAQWQLAQGVPVDELSEPARRVTDVWRHEHVLIEVEAETGGAVADVEDVGLREELERTHSTLLRAHGMEHLNISEIRSKNRAVTQAVSRDLYEQGAAGITFKSNLDNGGCLVVFEGRGLRHPASEPQDLSEDVPELWQVVTEYGLLMARG
jgi:hypothetical protein